MCVRLGDPDKVGRRKPGWKANRRPLGLTEPQVSPTSGPAGEPTPPPRHGAPAPGRPGSRAARASPPVPSAERREPAGAWRPLRPGAGGGGKRPTSARPAPSLPDYVRRRAPGAPGPCTTPRPCHNSPGLARPLGSPRTHPPPPPAPGPRGAGRARGPAQARGGDGKARGRERAGEGEDPRTGKARGDPGKLGESGERGWQGAGIRGGGRAGESRGPRSPGPAAPPPPACLPERPRPGAGVGPRLALPGGPGPGDHSTAASPKN